VAAAAAAVPRTASWPPQTARTDNGPDLTVKARSQPGPSRSTEPDYLPVGIHAEDTAASPALGARGCGFESRHPDQLFSNVLSITGCMATAGACRATSSDVGSLSVHVGSHLCIGLISSCPSDLRLAAVAAVLKISNGGCYRPIDSSAAQVATERHSRNLPPAVDPAAALRF